jgi:hypothetical protein
MGIVYFISAVVAGLIVLGFLRSVTIVKSADQKLFMAGQVPQPMPNGLYNGDASIKGSWQGKEFDSANQKGINLFGTGDKQRRIYPFRTWVGKGLTDTSIDVLKIDYDLPTNPFWLRPILDEVVDIGGGVLLGKLQFRLIPNFPFTLIFFRLRKA